MFYYADWEHQRKTTMNLQGEIGHRLSKHWALFVQGGRGSPRQGFIPGSRLVCAGWRALGVQDTAPARISLGVLPVREGRTVSLSDCHVPQSYPKQGFRRVRLVQAGSYLGRKASAN